MCVGIHTPLYCPVLEGHYFLQGYATSGILSSLVSLIYYILLVRQNITCCQDNVLHCTYLKVLRGGIEVRVRDSRRPSARGVD